MNKEIQSIYGNKLRLRVCGLCYKDDRMLMVKHEGLGSDFLWAPPGGGLEFGERATERLKKEFQEETTLSINQEAFLFACEYIHAPLHAIELFFEVKPENFDAKSGLDPEMGIDNQIITDVAFLNQREISTIKPENLHGIFKICPEIVSLRHLRGYYTIA